MLAKRIIPCLDVNKGRVVKGIKFLNLKDAGDPVDAAIAYDKAGADELVFLDITASSEKRNIMLEVVTKVAEQIFIPFTVGGGIRTIEDIRRLLTAGCDKVSMNTACVKNPDLIKNSSARFGSQCIVVAIDAKLQIPPVVEKGTPSFIKGGQGRISLKKKQAIKTDKIWEVFIHGGRTPTGIDAVWWAKKAAELGAGEILLTSMDFDGTEAGYDIELTKKVSEAVNIPVIASGGAGKPKHLYDVLTGGKADAALCASIFHYKKHTVAEVKKYLKRKGVVVRL
ncbi:MAG: imidazole glycerol phosphate synthase subunit HisF [Candidatus Omnitrophota bacterium]